MTPPKLRPTLTVDESTAWTGASRHATYRAIQEGTFPIPVLRIGRRILIPTRPLLEALGYDPDIVLPDTA